MPQQVFTNFYKHDDCPDQPGIEWHDHWSCMCNDRCPACGAEIEPHTSIEHEDLGTVDAAP